MNEVIVDVRRLGAGDGDLYKQIRMEALKNAPEAFGSTYEQEANRGNEYFEKKVTTSCVFGAFSSSEIVGVSGFYQQAGPKFEHKGVLWGMYVKPNFRNSGIGSKLVRAVLNHARDKVELVTLSVVTENERAISIYSQLGFESFGTEPKALRVGTVYYSEMHMMYQIGH